MTMPPAVMASVMAADASPPARTAASSDGRPMATDGRKRKPISGMKTPAKSESPSEIQRSTGVVETRARRAMTYARGGHSTDHPTSDVQNSDPRGPPHAPQAERKS